jgi:hypothetical protein
MARAERWVKAETDLEYRWELDPEPCIGCDCGSSECPCSTREPHETWCVSLVLPCPDHHGECKHDKYMASLGGICGLTDEYRRVVEAELAIEAMSDEEVTHA